MDTETFLAERAALIRALELRRLSFNVDSRKPKWSQIIGESLFSALRVTLTSGTRSSFQSWIPRLLMGVAAPALVGLFREGRNSFFAAKSPWARIASFLPFFKSRA